jgi:hypothetical protein
MVAGSIQWSSIDRYAERYGICRDDFDRFASLINAMDGVYRDYHKGKQ